MPFSGTAEPDQLKMLNQVLDDFCKSRKIVASSSAWQDAARQIMTLFKSGITDAASLRMALTDETTPIPSQPAEFAEKPSVFSKAD